MENDTVFIDIETTGLDVEKDHILCAGVKLNENEVQVFTNKEEFVGWYNNTALLPGRSVIWGGHNISFDAKFIHIQWGVALPDGYVIKNPENQKI